MFYLLFFLNFVASTSDNWAIILNSSKFYFNYRHTVNALLIYQTIKRYGVQDDHIIFMLPENVACHPRNSYPGRMYDGKHSEDIYSGNIEVDYRGQDLTPEAIVRVLTGRHDPLTPISKRLRSSPNSKVFFFMNGHGGDSFLKIQDTMVLRNVDLGEALKEMYIKERFGELLIILDTCQAFSMFNYVDLPNVYTMASSLTGQMAKSYGSNEELGISMADHFSFFFSDLFRGKSYESIKQMNLKNIIDRLPSNLILSDIGYKAKVSADKIKIAGYIGEELDRTYIPEVSYIIEEKSEFIWKSGSKNTEKQSSFYTVSKLNSSAFMAAVALITFQAIIFLINYGF